MTELLRPSYTAEEFQAFIEREHQPAAQLRCDDVRTDCHGRTVPLGPPASRIAQLPEHVFEHKGPS